MAQCANPISDSTVTNWAEGAGDGDGDAFDELDEGISCSGSPDDLTTYWLTTNEGSNTLRCNLTSVTDPGSSVSHFMRVRISKNASGGRTLDLEFELLDPDSIVNNLTSGDDLPATWTTFAQLLNASQANLIDSYGTLEIRVAVIEAGGGSPRVGWCSTMEFECPDAPVADREVLHRPKLAESLLTHGLAH